MRRAIPIAIGAVLVLALAAALALPPPLPYAVLRDPPIRPAIFDCEGRLLRLAAGRDASDATAPGPGDCARAPLLTPETLPETLVRATLAAEDRRFFIHPGFDPIGVARAALANLRARRLVAGGSTITQQLSGLLVPRPRTVPGKIAELALAFRIELEWSKREILAAYLNRVPYGNGCLGATAAAGHYFACTPAQLTAAQAALLAGLPRAPAVLDPRRHPERARARARAVLERMRRLGWLEHGEDERALTEPLELASRPAPFDAPHAVDWVLPLLPAGAGSARITIDRDLNGSLAGVLAESLSPHRIGSPPHGAIVVLDHRSGEVMAMVGSPAYADSHGGQWNAALAPRQPGSALKPFTYALAFADGHTPADLVADIPTSFLSLNGDYLPRNFSQTFHGPVRLREALASSYNVSAVRVLDEVGSPRLLELLRAAGVTTLNAPAATYGLGLTLGVGEVTLLDLCRAYALFPHRGRALPLTLIKEVNDPRGHPLAAPALPLALATKAAAADDDRLLPERAAAWVADILADPDARIPGFGAHGPLDLPFAVAAKTGTSSDFRDAWTVGFDSRYVVGTWVGNLDGEPMPRMSAARAAAPLFREAWYAIQAWETGRGAAGAHVAAPIPAELTRRAICALSGQALGTGCTRVVGEWLEPDAPLPPCELHRRAVGGTIETVLPAEYEPWLRRAGWPAHTASMEAGALGGGPSPRASRLLRIESPRDGERFYLAPDLPDEVQTVALRATGAPPGAAVTWEVDGTIAGHGAELRWRLLAGRHRIAARAGASHSRTVAIEVLVAE